MAQDPYDNPVLNAIYRANRRGLKAFLPSRSAPPPESQWDRTQRAIYAEYNESFARERQQGMLVYTSDELMRTAQKALTFNQYVLDFVNDTGYRDNLRYYDKGTLENAYRTSVYLFAFMRKAASMLASVRVVAEVKKGEVWKPSGEDEPVNQIFIEQGADLFYRGYMNYATYGAALLYKHKTPKAAIAWANGETDAARYDEGGFAGMHVIPGSAYELDIDYASYKLRGFTVSTGESGLQNRHYLSADECVYVWDYDHREDYRGTPIVSLALHNAVTNAAIARWASHYFTSGTMPMILVSSAGEDKYGGRQSDILREKQLFEQQLRGVSNSTRSVFTDRKVQVDQIGIPASEVAAPELNRTALEGIAAAVQLPPDLVIPPAGGSDNARHKYLMKQAWEDTILPLAEQFLVAFNRDLGLPEGMRLIVDRDAIEALQADRDETSRVEIGISQAGLESFNEAREKLGLPTISDLDGWVYEGGRWRSQESLVRRDLLIDETVLGTLTTAWDSNLLTRGQVHSILGWPQLPPEDDGYKFEVVQESTTGGMILPRDEVPGGAPGLQQLLEGVATPAANGNGNGASIPVTETASSTAPQKAVSVGAPDLYAIARIDPRDHGPLRALQALLARRLPPDTEARLVAPSTFHVTLWFAPVAGSADARAYLDNLPATVAASVIVTGLGAFDESDGKVPIYAAVALDGADGAALRLLREQTRIPLDDQRLSKFSLDYSPHITLAYTTPFDTPDVAALLGEDFQLRLRISAVDVSRGEDDLIRSIPAAVPQKPAKTPVADKPAESPQKAARAVLPPSEALLQARSALHQQRGAARRALDAASGYADPLLALLPEAVGVYLRETEAAQTPWADAQMAAQRALDAGWLDAHAYPLDNPIKAFLTEETGQADWRDELRAWRKSAVLNINKARERFEARHLPPSVVADIKAGLEPLAHRDKAGIQAVFDAALEALSHKATTADHVLAWAESLEDDDLKGLLEADGE